MFIAGGRHVYNHISVELGGRRGIVRHVRQAGCLFHFEMLERIRGVPDRQNECPEVCCRTIWLSIVPEENEVADEGEIGK
jgi:hypothetical protein